MKIGIRYKLFIAFLSAHIIVYMAMYAIGRYNFDKGFLDYISRIEEQQVPALVSGLSDLYEQFGSWEPLTVNMWRDLVYKSIPEALAIDGPSNRSRYSFDAWYYSDESEYSPEQPYLMLTDLNDNFIIPPPRDRVQEALEQANFYPVSARGEVVGYLGIISRQALSEKADRDFAEEQREVFRIFFFVMVILSAAIAFPLSFLMVRPIRDIVNGTRALTSGDYGSRIKVRTSDELGVLAEDFNTLAVTLDQNRKARQQWIADISHELRTPLAVLRGELESLQDGIRPLSPEALDSLHNEVVHLNSLVNDLHELSLSDLGALVYERKPLDLEELLEYCLDMFEAALKKESIHVSLAVHPQIPGRPIMIKGDEKRLMQLFSNLLQNTCRYTDKGGRLEIELRESPGAITVVFSDSGPGVRDEDLPRLFDRLYRVENSRNREQGGSGLGLAICKNIVDAHEGTIKAKHASIGGLTLEIVFTTSQVKGRGA